MLRINGPTIEVNFDEVHIAAADSSFKIDPNIKHYFRNLISLHLRTSDMLLVNKWIGEINTKTLSTFFHTKLLKMI